MKIQYIISAAAAFLLATAAGDAEASGTMSMLGKKSSESSTTATADPTAGLNICEAICGPYYNASNTYNGAVLFRVTSGAYRSSTYMMHVSPRTWIFNDCLWRLSHGGSCQSHNEINVANGMAPCDGFRVTGVGGEMQGRTGIAMCN